MILPKSEREFFYQNQFVPLLTYINDKYAKEVYFVQTNETLKLELNNKFDSPESAMNFLIKFCKEIVEVIAKKRMNNES